MIDSIRQKTGKFRSELHMGRYRKAIGEGQSILYMIEKLGSCTKYLQGIGELKANIAEEVACAKQLSEMLEPQIEGEAKLSENKSTAKSLGDFDQKIEQATAELTQNVSKWGKKKQSKPTKSFQPNQTSINPETSSTMQTYNQVRQEQKEQSGRTLDVDELQILQRELFLPLQLPKFFKTKESRLLICYYQKCNDLLRHLAAKIPGHKTIVELESLKQWTTTQKNEATTTIFVVPLAQGQETTLKKMLDHPRNLVLMYSENDRQLQAEKMARLDDPDYRIDF